LSRQHLYFDVSVTNQVKSVVAGVAGAVALTALHEVTRRLSPNAPRLDVLGTRSLSRFLGAEENEDLRDLALAGDLAGNGAYYALVGLLGRSSPVAVGTLLGILAGIGSVAIPPQLGLGSSPSRREPTTQAMSVGLYAAGGAVAGAVYRALR
jgi:hypothetical protein